MNETEKNNLVQNYIRAYNDFDVEKMLVDLSDEIIFKNLSNGETTLELKGIGAFGEQVRQAARMFSEREQKIEKISFDGEACEVSINYRGKFAADLPNGIKAGDEIKLDGKSIFYFTDSKISEIQDIS